MKIVFANATELMSLDAKTSLGMSEVVPLRISYVQLTAMSDESLMFHLKEGNGDALAVLFDRFHRLV